MCNFKAVPSGLDIPSCTEDCKVFEVTFSWSITQLNKQLQLAKMRHIHSADIITGQSQAKLKCLAKTQRVALKGYLRLHLSQFD